MPETSIDTHVHDDHGYDDLRTAMQSNFGAVTIDHKVLFTTDARGLWETYLAGFPAAERQYHNCNTCKRFIERFGGVVALDRAGLIYPVMWYLDDVPDRYHSIIHDLNQIVCKANVTGVFLTKEREWGTALTGDWSHMAITPPERFVYREGKHTAGQAMAEAKENYRTVATALSEFKPAVLDEALRILKSDTLHRSDKFVAPVQWLRDLHNRPKGKFGVNMMWGAIANAPNGYCHPRSAVTGSLIEDIVAGLPFADIKAKFDAKVAPLAYQRPQAAPSAGNIKAAEALVEKLGIAPSLHRRFARLEDLTAFWTPTVKPEQATGGVFGHLKPKNGSELTVVDLPQQTMTWQKFMRKVLPTAEQIEAFTEPRGRYTALTTAEDPNAPPILKWDFEDERNPLAWYTYPSGSSPSMWGLPSSTYVKVNMMTLAPCLYGSRPMLTFNRGLVMILDGAVDQNNGGNALFPECLKSDLHEIRSTIESYSKSAVLGGRDQASACGIMLSPNRAETRLRVFANGAWSAYRIDRWD